MLEAAISKAYSFCCEVSRGVARERRWEPAKGLEGLWEWWCAGFEWQGHVAGWEAIVRRRFRADWPRVGATLMDMMDELTGLWRGEWDMSRGEVVWSVLSWGISEVCRGCSELDPRKSALGLGKVINGASG